MLAASLVGLLLASPTPAAAAPPPRCDAELPGARLGPRDAPIQVVFYHDPSNLDGLEIWVSLRQKVADARGQLSVVLRLVRDMRYSSDPQDLVRRWHIAASSLGRTDAAMRIAARNNFDRLRLQILDRGQRPALARELGVTTKALDDALADPCTAKRLEENTRELRREWDRVENAGGSISNTPVFLVGDGALEDTLSALPAEINKEHARRNRAPASLTPPRRFLRRGVRDRVIYPPGNAGLLVGGVGTPHRLVLFIVPEARPRLARLQGVIEFMEWNPGRLAIQVIARGDSPTAQLLRRRFCAARRLGRELEYLRVLAEIPIDASPEPEIAAEKLERLLDNAPELDSCDVSEPTLPTPEDDDTRPGLPEGLWLDGAVINSTSDLDAIGPRLRSIEASRDPLDPLFSLLPSEEP
ncbi:MAG: hypothetical protein KC636_05865 [Myxococcales bacterium]|nr:hypothetical protein [Myxococcales bacterium]